jgi:hypothetical protein
MFEDLDRKSLVVKEKMKDVEEHLEVRPSIVTP